LAAVVDEAEPGEQVRFVVRGPSFTTGQITELTLIHTVEDDAPPTDRLQQAGMIFMPEGERLYLDDPAFNSVYQRRLAGFDFYLDDRVEVTSVLSPADRWPKEIFYIPAIALLLIVIVLQRRRQTKPAF
jgi:hypothetical protein